MNVTEDHLLRVVSIHTHTHTHEGVATAFVDGLARVVVPASYSCPGCLIRPTPLSFTSCALTRDVFPFSDLLTLLPEFVSITLNNLQATQSLASSPVSLAILLLPNS
jgi:hypothetical protein